MYADTFPYQQFFAGVHKSHLNQFIVMMFYTNEVLLKEQNLGIVKMKHFGQYLIDKLH